MTTYEVVDLILTLAILGTLLADRSDYIIDIHLLDGINENRSSLLAGLFRTPVHAGDGIVHHLSESCAAKHLFNLLGFGR